jgi:diguanylate cyclase (GGDEF)-like protein
MTKRTDPLPRRRSWLSDRPDLLFVLVGLMFAASLGGMVLIALSMARTSLALVAQGQVTSVQAALRQRLDATLRLHERLTISSEAVLRVYRDGDLAFATTNFGPPLYREHGIRMSALLDASGRVLVAQQFGTLVKDEENGPFLEATTGLRRTVAETFARETGLNGRTVIGAAGEAAFASVARRAAVVAVSPLSHSVATTGYTIAQPIFFVTVDILDRELVEGLSAGLQIPDPRLCLVSDPTCGPAEGRFAVLRDHAGAPVAHVVWGAATDLQDLIAWYVALAAVAALVLAGLVAAVTRWGRARMRETVERREHAEHAASHDALTGLPNRTAFLARLQEHTARATPGRLCGVVVFDLDRFKTINDTLGHAAGDAVIKAAGERAREVLGAGGLVARLAGDEFAALLPNRTSADAIEAECERLVAAIARPLAIGSDVLTPGASVGAAIAGLHGTDPTPLLAQADFAQYRAKAAGRGRVVVFNDEHRQLLEERERLDATVRAAVTGRETLLETRPVVAIDGTLLAQRLAWRMVGWPETSVEPFRSITGRLGLDRELDRRLLAAASRTSGMACLHVALAASSLRDEEVVLALEATASDLRASRVQLDLEVDDGFFNTRGLESGPMIERLVASGLGLIFRDFDRGAMSFALLRDGHFKGVKITPALLRDGATLASLAHLCRARGIGLTIIAEDDVPPSEIMRTAGIDAVETSMGVPLGRASAA